MSNRLPRSDEFDSSFSDCVSLIQDPDIVAVLQNQATEYHQVLQKISSEQATAIAEPYTWSITQVTGHLIDGEKVFGYRLHRFGCGDATPLASFDHGPLVENLDYKKCTLPDLLEEFGETRSANIRFLKRLPEGALDRTGWVGQEKFTARAMAFIMAGHVEHHFRIIKKRLGLTN